MPKIVPNLHNKILSVAEYHFDTHGYEMADMRKIAMEAEIAVGTIYLHYQNKETLFFQVILNRWSRLENKINAIQQSDIDAEKQLSLILDELIQEMSSHDSTHLWKEISAIHQNQMDCGTNDLLHLSIRDSLISHIFLVIQTLTQQHHQPIDNQSLQQLASFAFIMAVDACTHNEQEKDRNTKLIHDLILSYIHQYNKH